MIDHYHSSCRYLSDNDKWYLLKTIQSVHMDNSGTDDSTMEEYEDDPKKLIGCGGGDSPKMWLYQHILCVLLSS